MANQPTTLIIGGTSGLGLALAKQLKSCSVIITGRQLREKSPFQFYCLDLSLPQSLSQNLDKLISEIPMIDLLIFAAGFYQEGSLSTLKDQEIEAMIQVGLLAPALFLQRLLKKQKSLGGFIAITSTSQWTPRLLEPVYTAVKAGLGMLANSLSLDEKVGKVLVASPGGMKTNFYRNHDKNTETMLEPNWVAQQIVKVYQGNFDYKWIRILRNPPRIEVVEER